MSYSINDYPCPPSQGDTADRLWQETHFPGPSMPGYRLQQGPFGISSDDGWYLIGNTSVNQTYYSNPGMGFIGYAWEEAGASLAARRGDQTLQEHMEDLLALPFADVLYIRCDWRDVQSEPGKLTLSPIWDIAVDAAKKHGKRLAFRIQISNTVGQPDVLALPDFLQEQVTYTNVGVGPEDMKNPAGYREPRYDEQVLMNAVVELSRLLAERFDKEEYLEFVDLMMFGFWGEGHTNNCPNPIPFLKSEKVFLHLTAAQRMIWEKTPLCINIQTDISRAGNRTLHDFAVRSGMYLRTDSIMVNEPAANEQIANRPPHLATVLEDGQYRKYDVNESWFKFDSAGVNVIEDMILHALDLGGNYFCLWTEGKNLSNYNRLHPAGFDALKARLGYRIRPSWIYQRKRFGTSEIVVMFHNDGVASVPGHLLLSLADENGAVISEGCLDCGHPYAGKTRQCAFLLPEGMEGLKVYLKAYLLDQKGKRPVRFACEQNIGDRGFEIVTITRDNPYWRKDV